MVKQPPFTCEKTYFLRDIHTWVAANRPGWTRNDIDNTAETIWFADENRFRRRYQDHMRGANRNAQANLVGTLVVPPQLPYTVADIAFAKANKRLPQPPPAAAAAAAVAPNTAPAVAPVLPPPYLPSLANYFHYGFQPPYPLHDESNIPEMIPLEHLKPPHVSPAAVNSFLNNGLSRHNMDDSRWMGAKFLGAGAYGAAGLWTRVDANNNIIEQMVVKDCKPRFPHEWLNVTCWRDRLPREIAIHRRIDRERSQHEDRETAYRNLVRHKGYRLMMRKRRYRLYQKYYTGGNLFGALEQTFDDWKDLNEKDTPAESLEGLENLPQDLIWHVFRSLVKACLFLQHGTSDQNATAPVADWKPITHTDTHMNNIFIEPSDPFDEAALPNIVLADYGESFFPLESHASGPSDNPTEYVLNKPSDSHPPEICRVQHDENDQIIPIDEKSDVWKIGAVIWQMMTVDTDRDEVRREDRLERGPDGQLENVKWFVRRRYSNPRGQMEILPEPHIFYPSTIGYCQELRDLVRSCMDYYPANRATLRDLDRGIEQYLSAHPIQREELSLLEDEEDVEYSLNVPYVRRRYDRDEQLVEEEESHTPSGSPPRGAS